MIPRKELLEKLAAVEPGLAPAADPGIASHYWFTGDHLMTHNGRAACSVDLRTDFKGAVPRKIVALLKTSAADEVDLYEDKEGGSLIIKAGRSKLKLPMLIPDHGFPFAMPSLKNARPLRLDAGRFLQTMMALSHSIGTMTHTIDLLGVTVIDQGDRLKLFSSDGATITMGTVDVLATKQAPKDRRFIIPAKFAKDMVGALKGLEAITLEVANDDHIIT